MIYVIAVSIPDRLLRRLFETINQPRKTRMSYIDGFGGFEQIHEV